MSRERVLVKDFLEFQKAPKLQVLKIGLALISFDVLMVLLLSYYEITYQVFVMIMFSFVCNKALQKLHC